MIAVLGWLRRPDPAHENTLRRALHAEGARIDKTAAPGESGAAAKPNSFRELKDMTTIITRHARDLHAGDVITHDPDHDRDVRWRVSRPPVRTRGGEYALTDVTDLATGESHVTYYPALTGLRVEPAGGAA